MCHPGNTSKRSILGIVWHENKDGKYSAVAIGSSNTKILDLKKEPLRVVLKMTDFSVGVEDSKGKEALLQICTKNRIFVLEELTKSDTNSLKY